jgi:hypothetical protein
VGSAVDEGKNLLWQQGRQSELGQQVQEEHE